MKNKLLTYDERVKAAVVDYYDRMKDFHFHREEDLLDVCRMYEVKAADVILLL